MQLNTTAQVVHDDQDQKAHVVLDALESQDVLNAPPPSAVSAPVDTVEIIDDTQAELGQVHFDAQAADGAQ